MILVGRILRKKSAPYGFRLTMETFVYLWLEAHFSELFRIGKTEPTLQQKASQGERAHLGSPRPLSRTPQVSEVLYQDRWRSCFRLFFHAVYLLAAHLPPKPTEVGGSDGEGRDSVIGLHISPQARLLH